jgi:hypothetical protein
MSPAAAAEHCRRGNALLVQARFEEALACYNQVIALDPGHIGALCNRGVVLGRLQRQHEALASFDAAIALKPDCAEAFSNRASALSALDRFEEALESFDRAIALDPGLAQAFYNRAVALARLNRLDEALASYDRAIAAQPDYAQAVFNRALVLLLKGDLAQAWEGYEWRWRGVAGSVPARRFGCPQWRGEDVAGRTILLYQEQGHGDAIQFLRYVPMVAARGARVVLEVSKPLRRLVGQLPGVERVLERGEPVPTADCHSPLLSLPLVFGTTLATIPASVPYLEADAGLVAAWRRRLAPLGGVRVGVVWAGRASNSADTRRSIMLAQLAALWDVPGASFVSLQKGDAASQAHSLQAALPMHDWTEELGDFADTAALIAALDLVISVDTAVLHLAGALGKPVWLLNRFDTCWRWLLDRDDSPWYPTLRQFRQARPGDWDSVIAAVRPALIELIATAAPRPPRPA